MSAFLAKLGVSPDLGNREVDKSVNLAIKLRDLGGDAWWNDQERPVESIIPTHSRLTEGCRF